MRYANTKRTVKVGYESIQPVEIQAEALLLLLYWDRPNPPKLAITEYSPCYFELKLECN